MSFAPGITFPRILPGGVNLDAIIAAIYENVEAVIAVTGEENDTDETNASGLPPHSIELVVYGGLDEEIAKSSPAKGRGQFTPTAM